MPPERLVGRGSSLRRATPRSPGLAKPIEQSSDVGLDLSPRSQSASVIRRFDSEVLVDKTVLAARRRHGGNVVAHDEPDHVSILAVKVDIDR
jgi:hypothetical protein